MPSEILNIPLSENIIDFASDYLAGKGDKTALISGGRRPFLFIKRKLALEKRSAFYPPSFFTNDDFIDNIIFENTDCAKVSDIEAAYMLYKCILAQAPEMLKGGMEASFASFIPWAFEILSFIEQLDLENVSRDKLMSIKANAEIGYDVPENINLLLKNIFAIRDSFHAALEKNSLCTKGLSFAKAAQFDARILSRGFEEIILFAPFYLHKTEMEIFKKIFDAGKLTVMIHGDAGEYETLAKIYSAFGRRPSGFQGGRKKSSDGFDLNVYCAYDGQSQAALLKNLLKKAPKDDMENTVIVVPDEKLLQPVISEITNEVGDFNVSAGYPAFKTAVVTLVKDIVRAQLSRKGKSYYAKDMMKCISNPLVKNMRFSKASALPAVIAHKIEEALDSSSGGKLSGRSFVGLDEILSDKELIGTISDTAGKNGGILSSEELKDALKDIFSFLFDGWEKIETLEQCAAALTAFIGKLSDAGTLEKHYLNGASAQMLLTASRDIGRGEVSKLKFLQSDVLNIFLDLIKDKKIALPGSPLKGMQILGLLEARNLSFKNVFVIGMTDSAMPAVKKESPLVPREIMFSLGIEMAGREYEIQAYHFNRLAAGAKNLNLIYPDNEKEERSRFIEQLIWKKQEEKGDIAAFEARGFAPGIFTAARIGRCSYAKTPAIKECLKKMKYSYSRIDTYLRCRLEFYFKYVLGLDEGAEVGKEISGSDIGTFVHKFLQGNFCEGVTSEQVKSKEFGKSYVADLLERFENTPALNSREDAFLIKEVLEHRMRGVLDFERSREFGSVYACEKEYVSEIECKTGKYTLYCVIDRIDRSGMKYSIFDYKTGRVDSPLLSKRFGELIAGGYDRDKVKKAVKSLQLPLYKYIFEKNESSKISECAVYDVKKAETIDFFESVEEDAGAVFESCMNIIMDTLDEINSGDAFEFHGKDEPDCANCKFFYMCR
ncbi:MAG: PD-(D/E)XK nuclease family protein [Endomicrobia bacterium]|nr:PD-(D/E)XK nuclease family protein [Endomicrobiia bacterium]